MIKKLIIKMMAAVEKLEGNINPQINITGPKIGKKDCLKECSLSLKWTKFRASNTNKATLANSDGWKVSTRYTQQKWTMIKHNLCASLFFSVETVSELW